MKLSDYAKLNNIKYRAAWNRYKQGKIVGAYEENGHIIIPEPTQPNSIPKIAIYSRVSTPKQKDDLKRQTERLKQFATQNGYIITEIVEEIASGVNDTRPKLTKLLENNNWNILLVEHKDRLTRTGYSWFNILLKQQNKNIIITNQAEDNTTDLIEDFTSIIYSFCARLYGQRGHKAKADKLIQKIDKPKKIIF